MTEPLILSAEEYSKYSTYDLLRAAEQGIVGVDQRLVHAIVDEPDKAYSDIVRFALEDRSEGRIDLSEDFIRIAHHLQAPELLPVLLRIVEQQPEDVSVDLFAAFRAIGQPAVGPLLELNERLGGKSDLEIPFLLSTLAVRDDRIFELLKKIADEDPIEASHCLSAYGDPAGEPILRQALDRVTADWEKSVIQSSIDRLTAPEPGEEEPFEFWANYPAEAGPEFDLLPEEQVAAFLDSSDEEYRWMAAQALSGEEALPFVDKLLEKAQNDSSAVVRGFCWQALGAAADDDSLARTMRKRLEDASTPAVEKTGLAIGLAQIAAEERWLHKQIKALYEDPETRARAMHAMALSLDPQYIPIFVEHIDDPDEAVQVQAIEGVGFLEISSEADRIADLFDDDAVRTEALQSYALCAKTDLSSRSAVRKFYEGIEDLAGGLSRHEEDVVKETLNFRLARYEREPAFDEHGEFLEAETYVAPEKAGRNDPCPCGSGKKYKKCCGAG